MEGKMSEEQFQRLLATIRGLGPQVNEKKEDKSKGSFSKCQAKFGGQRDHAAVEEFITAVETYKEIEAINDRDALRGLSLLFYGIASTWWKGVRRDAKTWQQALNLIRDHFSPTKPPYQIYVELFEDKQSSSSAVDTFVCKKRALLAQLPEGRHDVDTELDFIYGMLCLKYRQHVARHEVTTFRELLDRCRAVERNL